MNDLEKDSRIMILYLYERDVVSVFQKDGRVKIDEGILPEDYEVIGAHWDHSIGPKGAFAVVIWSATFPLLPKTWAIPPEIPYERVLVQDDSTGRRRHVEILRPLRTPSEKKL